ncbi:MAG TPA: LysM domain-containing protein [Candidatus Limnocylindrales bacterium]|nr:LysM domain-containing protein [Candidatus Limnocylindrales bacterium]
MRPSHRRHRRALAVTLFLGLALVTAGCLPASVRPTAPPPPTPTPSPTPLPTPSPTPAPPTPTPAPTFELYKVRPGDTLTTIARRYKTDGRSIAYWNRDRYKSLNPESLRYAPDKIKVGWTLKILRGQTYVPPEDDSESGELYTPPPDDLDPEEPDASATPSASP